MSRKSRSDDSEEVNDDSWKTDIKQWLKESRKAHGCIQKREISATLPPEMKITDPKWNPAIFQKNWRSYSPMIDTLLKVVEKIDAQDLMTARARANARGLKQKPGEGLHKHLIFAPAPSRHGSYGPQLVVSAMAMEGYKILKFQKEGPGRWSLGEQRSQYENESEVEKRRTVAMLSSYPFRTRVFVEGGNTASRTQRETKSEAMKDAVLDVWKANDNVDGERLRFCVIDRGFSTGINFRNTKYVHILGKLPNQSMFQQIVGRITRMCGHDSSLYDPIEGYTVTIFVYVGVDDNGEDLYDYSVTTSEYNVAAGKLLQMVKEAAVDRGLNDILLQEDTDQKEVMDQLHIPL